METVIFLVVFIFSLATSGSVNLADKRVFSPAFYINTNPEVSGRGVNNPLEAQEDWLTTGLKAGLQGCGNFHSRQYLERYPDLKQKFGENYTAAVEHYLTEGLSQGLLGYVEGGYGGRWTISSGKADGLFISASSRMGGAIDSVVFDNTEFINSYDHGRELQMAVLPAFWLRPGDAEGGDTHNANCHKGSKAINTVDTYNNLFAKTVNLGCPGVGEDPCFAFNSSVTVAGELPEYDYAQVEGPTGYHTEDFNISSSLDVTTGHLVDYNSSLPLVFSTWDLQHAFGIWAPPGQFTDYPLQYAVFHFLENVRSFADKTNKWSVVWKKNFLPPNTGPWELNYTVFVCVGTQQDAAECLMKLVTYHDHRYR